MDAGQSERIRDKNDDGNWLCFDKMIEEEQQHRIRNLGHSAQLSLSRSVSLALSFSKNASLSKTSFVSAFA